MKLIDRLQEGDIVYSSCVGVLMCHHVGIVYFDGKKKRIFHNSPYNKNKYGGSVCSESWEDFIREREVVRVVRARVTNDEILKVTKKHKKEVWDSLFFNCEDYVLEIVEGSRRSDVRDAWKIAALGILIISLY